MAQISKSTILLIDIINGKPISDVLNDIINNNKSAQMRNNQIAVLKSILRRANRHDDVKYIEESSIVTDVIDKSNAVQETNRLNKVDKPFYINDIFQKHLVLERLHAYLQQPNGVDINVPLVFCDMMIAFASRPHELHKLIIDDEGMVYGYGKNAKNEKRQFMGLLNVDDSRKLHSKILGPCVPALVGRSIGMQYGMHPRQFRVIGARYISDDIEDPGLRQLAVKKALRHSGMSTSILYYSVKDCKITYDAQFSDYKGLKGPHRYRRRADTISKVSDEIDADTLRSGNIIYINIDNANVPDVVDGSYIISNEYSMKHRANYAILNDSD